MKPQKKISLHFSWAFLTQAAFIFCAHAEAPKKEPYREIEPMRILPAAELPTSRPYNLNEWNQNQWPNANQPLQIEPPLAPPIQQPDPDPNPNTPELKAYTQMFKEIKIAIRGRRMLLKIDQVPGPLRTVTVYESEPIYQQRCDIEARCRNGEPHLIESDVKNCERIKPYKMGSCEYGPTNMRSFIVGARQVEKTRQIPTQITKKRIVQEGLTKLSPRQRACAFKQRDHIQNVLADDSSADTLKVFLKFKKIDIFLTDERWVALRNKKKAFIEEAKNGKLVFQIALVNPPRGSESNDPYCVVSEEFEIQLYLMDLIREQHFENEYHSQDYDSEDSNFFNRKNLNPFNSEIQDATLIDSK